MTRLLCGAALILAASAAHADQGLTVDSLLKQGYEIKAAFPSKAGPGLVLEKSDQVMMCFVAETPDSAEVATQYCKPVH